MTFSTGWSHSPVAGVFAVSGVIAVRSASEELSAVVAIRGGHGVAGIVRLLMTVVGYLLALVTLLSLLELPVHRLLLSGAITGGSSESPRSSPWPTSSQAFCC